VMRRVRLGDPLDPSTFVGPLATEASMARVLGVVADATSTGDGKLLVGGGRAGGELSGGWFVEPTVVVDVDPASALAQQEVFGPVLAVLPFDDEAHAVELANGTAYGLSNYVQSSDPRRIQRVARQLRSGTVGVNGGSCLFPGAPFGGVGLSGMGREGGRAGVEELTRLKAVLHK
jgi:aldehyde dehydrogenase (NAD+)